MKKVIIALFITLILLLCACQNNPFSNSNDTANTEPDSTEEVTTESKPEIEPKLSDIRTICNLATLECHFNNVAKSKKSAGSGISHLGEKDRDFWIEYAGVVKIGVDMSKVKVTTSGETVTIYMPDAEILSYKADPDSMSETIAKPDSINQNPITSEDKTKSMNTAETQIRENIEQNSTLLVSAKDKAKTLIENYINMIGEETGTNYNIVWKDLEE